jgi:6-phosphofructokinase 1
VPKTIDNDVGFIDRSFGFASAVEAAQASIRTAKIEAMCNIPNGIGIIKVSGALLQRLTLYSSYQHSRPLVADGAIGRLLSCVLCSRIW